MFGQPQATTELTGARTKRAAAAMIAQQLAKNLYFSPEELIRQLR
jgi:hypothetical protein